MGKLDLAQLEQLKEIGAQLQQARQEQSKTLEEITAKTYIPLRLLQAIESGQDTPLPEPVFVQGFIRRYADALGLDGSAVSKQFSVNSAATMQATPSMSAPLKVITPPVAEPIQPSISLSKLKESKPTFTYAIAGVIGFAALGGLVFAATQLIQSRPITTSARDNATASVPAPSPVASPSVSPSVEASPSVSPSPIAAASPADPSSLQVQMTLTDASWIRITIDGKTDFEGTLPKGESRTLTATESLTILAGNAGAVTLSENGATAKPMGDRGAVERVTLTRNAAPQP